MTLIELKRRHETGDKLNKATQRHIRAQMKRECAVRGCHNSLAFTSKNRLRCDEHKHIVIAKLTTTGKIKTSKRYTKAELKRINREKKKRYEAKHGIVRNKTVRNRVITDISPKTNAQVYSGQILIYENYKEPLKPIEGAKGYGYYGTLATTDDKEFLQCHICGNLFANLGMHIRKHKVTGEKYKVMYALSQTTALVSEPIREQMQSRAVKPFDGKLPDHLIEYNRKVQSGEIKHRAHGKPPSLEWRNKRGLCPDQVLDKIRELRDELGRVPTYEEFYKKHNGRYIGPIKFQHGSWSEAVKKLGMTPRGEARTYSKEQLLELLVEFKDKHGRIPMTSDFNRGLLPSRNTYFHHFGTLNDARIEAGLNAVVPMPFGQIIELSPEQYIAYRLGKPVPGIKEPRLRYRRRMRRRQKEAVS